MILEISLCLYILLIQQVLQIQADQSCYYYYNQTTLIPVNCEGNCCLGKPTSAQTACCYSITWNTLAVPIFVVTGVCLFAVCLVYFRPLLKCCLCGFKCPCRNRSRVTTPSPISGNNNPVYVMNNGDLPDYETVIKDSRTKDITPPPYNFVAAHPTDFGIETRVPSAPPQYRSRNNSIAILEPTPPIEV